MAIVANSTVPAAAVVIALHSDAAARQALDDRRDPPPPAALPEVSHANRPPHQGESLQMVTSRSGLNTRVHRSPGSQAPGVSSLHRRSQ